MSSRSRVPRTAARRQELLPVLLGVALLTLVPGLAPAPVGAAPGSPTTDSFSILSARLVPGGSSAVTIATPEATSVRSGRLVLKFSPPIFLDTPAVAFPGAPADLTFGLTALGAGRYAVDFAVPPAAADLGPGAFLEVSGVLLRSLRVGGWVNVLLDGAVLTGSGEEMAVGARDARFPLIADPYPKLTVHVQDGYDLVPGTTAIIELQTYNPKLISDGQICLRVDRSAFTSVESIAVQGDPDVSYVAGTDEAGLLVFRFSSPTSSINRFEGAILRIGMKVAPDLPPGFETVVEVDVDRSFLRDHSGELVPLGGDSGRFRVAYPAP